MEQCEIVVDYGMISFVGAREILSKRPIYAPEEEIL